jgi:glucose-6-phosphate 1-epimerase
MDTHDTIDQLNERFSIPGALRFESGEGGLARAVVDTDLCSGSVYLQGAHVADFTPAGHKPVLFVSPCSNFAAGQAIRGGVPVCFPWFGPHPTDQSAPAHGRARITAWQVRQTSSDNGAITLELHTTLDPFSISHRVTFGRALSMTLRVLNPSDSPATFEAALHTYFAVSDVRQVEIKGLEHTFYLDSIDANQRKNQGNKPITFAGETDRLYVDTQAACVLTDPGLGRRITVDKSGSESTVIWNPWIDKAKRLNDMCDDDWPSMVCIETANAGPNAVVLDVGAKHEMNTTIGVVSL